MKSKFVPRQRNGKPIRDYKKRHEFIIPGVPSGVKVPGNTPGDLEKALKIMKRQMKDSGVIAEFKSRREYEKPSAINRKKMNKAVRMQQKWERDKRTYDKHHPCWTAIINGQAV